MAPPFEDIIILDLDVQKTTWSRVHSAMRTLYLRLNRDPDLAWNKFFFEERNSRIEVKRHGLWIEDGYIVFDCLLIDVDNHHLPDIRRSIAYANERSRELREKQIDEREQLKAKARDEAEVLKALRANIREERPEPVAPAVFETDPAPEPDTAHSLEEAAHAQLEHASAPESIEQTPAKMAESDHERRLREFYEAMAPKVPAPSPWPELVAEPPPAATLTVAPAAPEPEPAPEPASESVPAQEAAPAQTSELAPTEEPASAEASEFDLESKRNDWRARFRAALEHKKH